MRIIGRDIISTFFQKHSEAKPALQSWLCEVENASWSAPKDILVKYNGADIFPDNRVVFHSFDGEFKLLTLAIFGSGIIVVKKIGTIAEYGKWNL